MEKHKFEQGHCGCDFRENVGGECECRCGKRKNHLIHKAPKIRQYKTGEVVGRYVVGEKGEFRKIKDVKD